MNTCNILIDQFKKSINGENFKVKYNYNYNEHGFYISNIIGIYDNKICNMTIDEEKTILDDKSSKQICRYDTLYSDWLEMNVCTYCEIKK